MIVSKKTCIFLAYMVATYGAGEAAVLQNLGLTPEQVAEIAKIDEATVKDFKPETYISQIHTGLYNNNEFLSKIPTEKLPESVIKSAEAGQYGRFINEAKGFIEKTLGVDLKDLSEAETKSVKGILTKSFEKYGAKMNNPEALKELQTNLQKTIAEKEGLEQTHTTKLTEEVNRVKSESNQTLTRLIVRTTLQEIGITAKPKFATLEAIEYLNNQYSLVPQGDTISIRQKVNPELDVLKGSKPLTLEEALTEFATKEGILKPATKEEQQESGTVKMNVEKGSLSILPDYIRESIENNLSNSK